VTATITIEPGPANARSDPTTGLRWYTWQGRKLPSVTSIRRMAGMPHGLHNWALTRVIERATLSHDELTAMLTRERRPRERVLEKNRIAEASAWLRAASTEERDAAAALGTAVHDAAARGLTPDQVPDEFVIRHDGQDVTILGFEVRPRLAQYLDWKRTTHAMVLLSERQAWHLTLGYAGSFDLLIRTADGRVVLVDIKTGQGIYPEHLLQVLAYANAEFVGQDDVVDEEATAWLHAVDAVAVLHIGPDRWEWRELDATSEAWRAFRGLLAFATWMSDHPTADSITRTRVSDAGRVAA